MDELKARPLRQDEVDAMSSKVGGVLIALSGWRDRMPEDSDMRKMLDSAVEIISDLHEQWRLYAGRPAKLDSQDLESFADTMADMIHGKLKIQLMQGKL